MSNTEVSVVNDNNSVISGIQDSKSNLYSSFSPESMEDKKKLYNAISKEGVRIKEKMNMPITVNDIVVMPVDIVNEETGEVSNVPRCVLLNKDGDVYTASSWGVYRALQKLQGLFGSLHFEDGIVLIPREVKTKKGFTITFEVE